MPTSPDYINVVSMDVTRFTPIYERAVQTREHLLATWDANALAPEAVIADLFLALGLPEEIPVKD